MRIEKDSMGEVKVPRDALYSAQTQRATTNFNIGSLTMPMAFVRTVCLIKSAAAKSNLTLNELDDDRAHAIMKASEQIISEDYTKHFPVSVFQTGSGTSTNMNVNEVLANLAKQYTSKKVHPNDDVNKGQSSNDVIPTAIHVSAALELKRSLLPSLNKLSSSLKKNAGKYENVIKTGRTHLMDAMPLSLMQEILAWQQQINDGIQRIESTTPRLHSLAQGGTAVGTGINAHPQFSEIFCKNLSESTDISFQPADNLFEKIGTQDTAVELSSQLKTVAVSMMKIANDLRWMNSGPLAGLSEIRLKALQPGSSIMPGKVNPVLPEAIAMACAQIIGNDATITIAGQSGNFQLNVMLPVIAYNLLQSIELLAGCADAIETSIESIEVLETSLNEVVDKNPILVTALNSIVGYDKAAQIAKTAYAKNIPILEVALEMTDIPEKELKQKLDPKKLAYPHA